MSGVDKNISNIAFTRTVLGVLLAVIVLSIDAFNPVKLFLHVFNEYAITIKPWHIATFAFSCMIYVTICEYKELLYFGAKIFINSMLSIFFRDIEVIGKDKLPRHGPMIFVINHSNQFVDAMIVLGTTSSENFKVSYLMAEKSFQRPVIGDIAAALDVVPIKRAQDSAIPGIGTITFLEFFEEEQNYLNDINGTMQDDGGGDTDNEEDATVRKLRIIGDDAFTTSAFRVGDKLRPNDTSTTVKVVEILNDKSCIVDATQVPEKDMESIYLFKEGSKGHKYDILKHVDLHSMFEKVLDKLAMGGVFGIFPEGGSHDRTDLLPLKVGVALIAYSALERDGVSVPIIPVGLNYFKTHKWRGKCLVEYGNPVYIDPTTLSKYQLGGSSKRSVCNDLLDRIQDSMRSVIVTMPDYDSLQVVHTARRLYQGKNSADIDNTGGNNNKEKEQDLLRRFAVGYKLLMSEANKQQAKNNGNDGNDGGDDGDGNIIPQAWFDLQERIKAYRRELLNLGLRDYQVSGLDRGNENSDDDEKHPGLNRERIFRGIRVVYKIVHLLVLITLGAIPNLFLNLPVRLLADVYAEQRRQKALANSKVKIHGYDVMLTEKLTFCIVVVPLLWLLYGLIMVFFTNFDAQTITLCFMCFPVFSYAAIISSEAGMVDGKDIKPYFLRLLPSTRRRMRVLPEQRRQLRRDLRLFVKKVGPAFGELYHGKDVDWKQINDIITKNRSTIMKRAVSTNDIADIAGVSKKDQ